MARMYKNQVEFVLVYIREAHSTNGWQVEQNEKAGVLLPDADSFEKKTEHASLCALKLNIQFTTVIDNMDNQVEQAYTAWPDRLYLVGKDGRIAWKGRPGPKGFLPTELAVAIEEELERNP